MAQWYSAGLARKRPWFHPSTSRKQINECFEHLLSAETCAESMSSYGERRGVFRWGRMTGQQHHRLTSSVKGKHRLAESLTLQGWAWASKEAGVQLKAQQKLEQS